MKFNKLYLPIKSVNLGHYFAKGCICPATYLAERNPDLQNRFDSGVLLCKKIHTEETDCSIEIQLTEGEIEKYSKEISTEFLFYKILIPVSRISKIIFKKIEQAKTTIYDINQARAFIPNELIEINNDNINITSFKDIERINLETNNVELLNRYNRLLGGFALMRLGKNNYQNFPINFFLTLSNISNPIRLELNKVSNSILELMNDNYAWLITGSGKYKNLHDMTYSKISEQTFFDFAKDEGVKYETKLGRIDLDSIDKNKNSYLIAILASYNNKGARRTLDNFIEDLNYDKFPTKKKEGISLMFGINKGYEAFRNSYKTDNFSSIVKFKLDTILDYYIIEGVYQYVISLDIKNDFSYISHIGKINVDKNRYETYSLFDNDIIYEVKEEKLSLWTKLKRIFFSEITSKLTNNFEQKLGFKLHEEQKQTIEKDIENLFQAPFSSLFQNIENEQSQLIADINDKKQEISQLKNREIYLWENLREINPDLFDRIDANHDKILTNYEMIAYINKLKNANDKSQEVKTGYVVKDFIEEQSTKDKTFDPKIREEELYRIPLNDLKKIAKQHKIKNFSKYNKENKSLLIKLILDEERSINNLGL